ncbi:EAL domain-containing protein [Myxosarcina sp. GI1]|uniref:EAL domain-containing protein n=1 Tax=Myxosarcina sp. GI1 TaxID=1541065 RepID=UPI00056AEF36|nr:EAL domain-containing protein [Myxosarcina sp. GI1]
MSTKRQCAICDTLPCKVKETGKLYLWLPLAHSINKLIACLNLHEIEHQFLKSEQCLIVELKHTKVVTLVAKIETILTKKELQDSRVLIIEGTKLPQLKDFARVTNLNEFLNLSHSDWLLDLLASENFIGYFQPIVYAEDTSKIFAQECLLRGVDRQGQLISPGKLFDAASKANLMFQLDKIARLTAISEAARQKITSHIFINFAPTSIYDPVFCLRSTVEAIERQTILTRDRIVFEVVETEAVKDIERLKDILDFYRNAGFSVALDDIGAGYSNLNLLHQLRPDFIKLDMELIRNVHQDRYKAVITEKILEIAQNLNIQTIAEGIESEAELNWVRQHGANFVQGYFIAKPSNPPITTISNSTKK